MFYVTSIIFYALPLPMIILMMIGALLFIERKLRRNTIFIVVILFGFWFVRSYRFLNTDATDNAIEIVYWNSGRNHGLKDAIAENGDLPDVLVLVECDTKSLEYAEMVYPDYEFYLSNERIAVFSKTPINFREEITAIDNSTILKFETLGYHFYAIDVSPNILNFRKISLNFLESEILENEKTIVLGDFNTPFESVHFNFFKENFINAFNEKGHGFRETWFWNIPLLMIDHIWVSRDLKVLKVVKINTLKSDHSMLRMFLNK